MQICTRQQPIANRLIFAPSCKTTPLLLVVNNRRNKRYGGSTREDTCHDGHHPQLSSPPSFSFLFHRALLATLVRTVTVQFTVQFTIKSTSSFGSIDWHTHCGYWDLQLSPITDQIGHRMFDVWPFDVIG